LKVIAIIPARCGSKGFLNKNIAKIDGKTLIEWAIEVAKKSRYITDIYISTDCEEYEKIALKAGAKSIGLRSKELASDTAKSVDVVINLINNLDKKYDYVVLLQPTTPIRRAKDIDFMIENIGDYEAMVTVTKVEEPHPYKMKIIENGIIKPLMKNTSSEIPRQMLPDVYKLSGAIYLIKMDSLLKNKTFLPEKTKPYVLDSWVNIDSEDDYIFLLAKLRHKNISMKELLDV